MYELFCELSVSWRLESFLAASRLKVVKTLSVDEFDLCLSNGIQQSGFALRLQAIPEYAKVAVDL